MKESFTSCAVPNIGMNEIIRNQRILTIDKNEVSFPKIFPMAFEIKELQLRDNNEGVIQIIFSDKFTREEAEELRKIVESQNSQDQRKVYLDLTQVSEIDLIAFNEIMQSYRELKRNDKDLVLVYLEAGPLEEWLKKSQVDQFITTAKIPKENE